MFPGNGTRNSATLIRRASISLATFGISFVMSRFTGASPHKTIAVAEADEDHTLRAAHAAGVHWFTRCTGRFARPGSTETRYSRIGSFRRRQVSTTERMAATFGPACSLPTWIQFLRPSTSGRMEFSARLLLSSIWGYSRKRINFDH